VDELVQLAERRFGDMVKSSAIVHAAWMIQRFVRGDRQPGRAPGTPVSGFQHRDLASARWWELSLPEQFGNIGSEISRAIRWASRDQVGAFYRALDLFDLTLDDPRHCRLPARLREIARAREVVADFFAGPNQYGSTAPSLQKYFDAYAVAARRTVTNDERRTQNGDQRSES